MKTEYFNGQKPLPLTAEQATALQPIQERIKENQHEVFLLYGVTGSGKTEVYLTSDCLCS